jgi:hypothetical protein
LLWPRSAAPSCSPSTCSRQGRRPHPPATSCLGPPACPSLPPLELLPAGVHACVYADGYMRGTCSAVMSCP